MPLLIVSQLDGQPSPVAVPGPVTLRFGVRSAGQPVHARVAYELDTDWAVRFLRKEQPVSSFLVDLGVVNPVDREIRQQVDLDWGPGALPPDRQFRVIARVSDESAVPVATSTYMVLTPDSKPPDTPQPAPAAAPIRKGRSQTAAKRRRKRKKQP